MPFARDTFFDVITQVHGHIWWFTNSENDYGSPTAVYRYKEFKQ